MDGEPLFLAYPKPFCSAAVCMEQFSVPCQGTLFCSDVLLPALKAEGETHLFML